VLAALSLFAAYWPLSAIVTGVVVAARASGADKAALGVMRRGAGRVIDRVRRWTGLDRGADAENPAPSTPLPAPAPTAPDPPLPAPDQPLPAPEPSPVAVTPPSMPTGEAPLPTPAGDAHPAPRPRRPRPPVRRRVDSASARRGVNPAAPAGIDLER
jgi:hypothetical protein